MSTSCGIEQSDLAKTFKDGIQCKEGGERASVYAHGITVPVTKHAAISEPGLIVNLNDYIPPSAQPPTKRAKNPLARRHLSRS